MGSKESVESSCPKQKSMKKTLTREKVFGETLPKKASKGHYAFLLYASDLVITMHGSIIDRWCWYVQEQSGAIADQATALRDPAFYRWHAFLNDLFLKHKHTLPSYTDDEVRSFHSQHSTCNLSIKVGFENRLTDPQRFEKMIMSIYVYPIQ